MHEKLLNIAAFETGYDKTSPGSSIQEHIVQLNNVGWIHECFYGKEIMNEECF